MVVKFFVMALTIYRKMSDGMFLSACREVSKEFPDVAYDEDLLDRVCLKVCWLFTEIFGADVFTSFCPGCDKSSSLL